MAALNPSRCSADLCMLQFGVNCFFVGLIVRAVTPGENILAYDENLYIETRVGNHAKED